MTNSSRKELPHPMRTHFIKRGGVMNIVFSEGGNILLDFEIAKNSHVYFNNGAVDFYRDWEELPSQDRERYLKIVELVFQTLNTELTKLAK
jgi:hypothetical protein